MTGAPQVLVVGAGPVGVSAALMLAGRRFGVDLPVVAATVERLGTTPFHRSRILVPSPLPIEDVLAELRRHGAWAAESTPGAVR